METSPAVVEGDLPCAICGYNLKGLAADINCPECGQPIARTLSPNLHRSNPEWLRRQAATMLILAAVGQLRPGSESSYGPVSAHTVFHIVMLVAAVVGVFRLSAPELPAAAIGVPFDSWRRGIRAAAVISAAIYAVTLVSPRIDFRLLEILSFVAVASLLALDWLVGVFLHRLAVRSGDLGIIAHAHFVRWALPLQYALYIALGILSRVATNATIAEHVITTIYWLGSIVSIIYVLLVGRMHEMFRSAAKSAEASSAAPVVPISS